MVYFIANGVRPLPAADWLYSAPVPTNGNLVAFMINDYKESGGDHGTFCASAVVGQGIIDGYAPDYKPNYTGAGDGMVQGSAPGAKIIAMGNCAVKCLLRTEKGITSVRGVFGDYEGVPIMPTFHPAYLLRNPAAKKEAWIDLQQVMKRLGSTVPK